MPKIQQKSEMLTIMFCHLYSSNVHLVGLNNGGLGRSCEVHSVCGSSVVVGSIVTLKKFQTVRGNELHAFLVKDGHISCKVGFAAKIHAEENADNLDGAFLRVISVVTQQNECVGDRRRMYRNYGSAQATVIPASQVSIQFDV
jgi:hypothetical protein